MTTTPRSSTRLSLAALLLAPLLLLTAGACSGDPLDDAPLVDVSTLQGGLLDGSVDAPPTARLDDDTTADAGALSAPTSGTVALDTVALDREDNGGSDAGADGAGAAAGLPAGALVDSPPPPEGVVPGEVSADDVAAATSTGLPGGHTAGLAPGSVAPPVTNADGISEVTFDHLYLEGYVPPNPRNPDPSRTFTFPDTVAALDGQRVVMEGFMIPTTFSEGEVHEFALSRDPPGCCFGSGGSYDSWVDVTIPEDKPGVEYTGFMLVRVVGRLDVGEKLSEYGYVLGLYRLDAESVQEMW